MDEDKRAVMRIVRTIFLLAVAAFFMPSPPEERLEASAHSGDHPPATEFLAAAVSTVADVTDFCTRQAAVCDTAHYLAVKLEGKTKYGIELLYQWANEPNRLAMPQQAHDDEAASGRRTDVAVDAADAAGRNTLRLEDLIPEWRAPKSEPASDQSPS
jgi:hypothetical protein